MSSPLDDLTYILVDRKPVRHPNNGEWSLWFMVEANRRVAKTTLGDIWISTVFTGIAPEPGMLFETQVFGGKHNRKTWRCRTWNEAEEQHEIIVEMVKAAL
jgi:hypothetical protein